MEAVSLAEAVTRFEEIAAEVARRHDRVHITCDGHGDVVLISALDLESLEATLELLCDPESLARIREAEDAERRGDVIRAEDMARLMMESRDTSA